LGANERAAAGGLFWEKVGVCGAGERRSDELGEIGGEIGAGYGAIILLWNNVERASLSVWQENEIKSKHFSEKNAQRMEQKRF
jgi:hypothetical protein